MNEPVDIYQNSEAGYADILHEYFIPADSINRFIDEIRRTIPKYKVDLMNITIRNVLEDRDAYMCYARKEVFGFVMLFNEAVDPGADREMRRLKGKGAENCFVSHERTNLRPKFRCCLAIEI